MGPSEPEIPAAKQEEEEEEQPRPAPRPRRRIVVQQADPTPPAPAPTAPGPVQVPQLAPVISPETRQAYDKEINDLIERTNRNVATARARRLSAAQQEMIERALSFVQEAQQVRSMEPAAARSLAARAELMSREALSQ